MRRQQNFREDRVYKLPPQRLVFHPPLKLHTLPSRGDISRAVKGFRKAYDEGSGSYIDYTVYDRYKLFSGAVFKGPAIIEEKETTIVATPNTELTVDKFGTITISL